MSLTLLVIEDDDGIRDNLVELLTIYGEDMIFDRVWGVSSGREALEFLKTNAPSLILCDLGLPDLSGEDVLREIRANPGTAFIPFVFLTANPSQQAKGMALGADDYISKPFNIDNLLSRIRNVISKYQKIQERGKQFFVAALPVDAILDGSLTTIHTNAQLILLDDSISQDTRQLVQTILHRSRELATILSTWQKST